MLNSLKAKAIVRMISEKEEENFEYDHARFVAHSSAVRRNYAPEAILADVISVAHSLEKGLALAAPRSGFGSEKVAYLLETVPLLENAGCSGLGTKNGRGVLKCYVEFHDQRGLPLPENLETELRRFVKDGSKHEAVGGFTTLQRTQIVDATNFDYDRFVRTRYSIREFTGEPVAPEVVRRAVSQSVKSPCTRNREMRRVYTAYDPEVRKYLLSFQNGNRPFGEKAGAILVITTDMRQFDMIGERNQGWIDGGLFAMSLVYAFHALYCTQPLLPIFAQDFRVSPAASSLALSLSTGFLAISILGAAVVSELIGRRGLMFASVAGAALLNLATERRCAVRRCAQVTAPPPRHRSDHLDR